MSVLYRAYRPQKFTDLIGQDRIRQILESSLIKNTTGHAYLFSGPRGTGKTTTARLLAKALSCQARKDANPCNACEACLAVNKGSFVDVLEIDAASNRGIDDVRQLKEAIMTAPVSGKFKIYIIDEVHMLTKEAFNALLKTLEEPPSHIVFILATTELNKVPETILSRCQRLFFNRAKNSEIVQLLKKVAHEEKIKASDEALDLIAIRSEGSYRDGLSLLGSVASSLDKIDGEGVRGLLHLPAKAQVEELVDLIFAGDKKALANKISKYIDEGGDLAVLVKETAVYLRGLVLDSSPKYPEDFAIGLMEQLLLTLGQSRHSPDPEAVIIAKLLSVSPANASKVVIEEKPVKEVVLPKEIMPAVVAEPKVEVKVEETNVVDLQKTPEPQVTVDAITPKNEASEPVDSKDLNEFWGAFLTKIKDKNHALYAIVRAATLQNLTSDKIIIGVAFRFYSERLYDKKNKKIVEDAASEIAGRTLILECVVVERKNTDVTETESGDCVSAVVEVFEVEG